jgi:hypothetical protein
LTSVVFEAESNLQEIDVSAFEGCLIDEIAIPPTVTKLRQRCFADCRSLRRFVIGHSTHLIEIDCQAFAGSAIESMALPATLKRLGERCFHSCQCLRQLTIGTECAGSADCALESLEADTFAHSALESISLPDSVTAVHGLSFVGLKSVSISESNPSFAFEGPYFISLATQTLFRTFSDVAELTIPSTVRILGESCFELCDKIVNVCLNIDSMLTEIRARAFARSSVERIMPRIPPTVKILHDSCFAYCKKLRYVPLEGNESELVRIGKGAFLESGIVDLIFPSSIQTIAPAAFKSCHSLSEVTFKPNSQLAVFSEELFAGLGL